MQTRSQSKRIMQRAAILKQVYNTIRLRDEEKRENEKREREEKEDKQYMDFRTILRNFITENENAESKTNKVNVVKKLYQFIDKEIPLIWRSVMRTNQPLSVKGLLMMISNKAQNLAKEIEEISVTMKDHKLISDTHSLLLDVHNKMQFRVAEFCLKFPELKQTVVSQ